MDKSLLKELPQKMNLISDLFSRVVFRDKAACQDLVRIILGDNFEVESVTSQYDITNLLYHGVILDILAKTKDNKSVHIEFQIENNDDHLRRVRYCTGSLDTNTLRKGQKYKELPDVYHIFITLTDFIGAGKTIYEIKRGVKDAENLPEGCSVSNGVNELYINLEIPLKDDSELASLLKYIKQTIPENEDKRFFNIVNSVKECRKENVDMKYYNSYEFFEEGRKEEQTSIIKNMLREKIDPLLISKCTEQPLEYILKLNESMPQKVCETGNYQANKERKNNLKKE